MKIVNFRAKEFRSIWDSNTVKLDDLTCLVGKNEAGKTALLKALYRLNPIESKESDFDVAEDYPRLDVEDYQEDVESGKRKVGTPIEVEYLLEDSDVEKILADYGPKSLTSRRFTLSKTYENKRYFNLDCNAAEAIHHIISTASLSPETSKKLKNLASKPDELLKALEGEEQTATINTLKDSLKVFHSGGFGKHLYDKYIDSRIPKFLYFDEYYQLSGHENIDALIQRQKSDSLKHSDYPLLGLIRLARIDLESVLKETRTINLQNKLEGASNHLSKKILDYWSQNKNLRMSFDIRPAKPGDPEGMTSGQNIWGKVVDKRTFCGTELGSRSRGFVWFFSFLAWYEDIKRSKQDVVLLLDEPGLSLHGKAQEDLLRYFQNEVKDYHQVIYTTHSPFMVDPRAFQNVRIVQDRSIDTDEKLPEDQRGTKVFTEVLDANEDSLFPLQGALGYEIHQSLFVGPNSLIVEGPSDLLYIWAMSNLLESEGRTSLSNKWTLTPVGGAGRVPIFVSLLRFQKGMKLATLIDIQKKDEQIIQDLYKKKMMKKSNVLTFGDFLNRSEADIEDMFDPKFYLELVNGEYKKELSGKINESDITAMKHPRILVRLEKYFESHPLKKGGFSHYRPARYFNENLGDMSSKISTSSKDLFEEAFKSLNKLL